MSLPRYDYDFVVVGSGFGGSVSAMRLAEKGYSVCVVEQGKRYLTGEFARTNWDVRKFLWLPALKCFGIQRLSLFRNVMILSGAGVGGGSLVYANTLLQPADEFFGAASWKMLADWKSELMPFYDMARKMLGVATNPHLTYVDRVMKECAEEMGRGGTFKPSEVGVFFGDPEKAVPDPYFGGKGPERAGCNFCGGCMVGCQHNAKNTLDKNYLYFAEKQGVTIIPETQVVDIRPIGSGDGREGYELSTERSTAFFARDPKVLRARQVVLSAGVLGTVSLLLRCKHVSRSLPKVSDRLGAAVRTNSEALVGVTEKNCPKEHDYTDGVAITSIFHPDDHTHIEPVRYPKGSNLMRLLTVLMTDGGNWIIRPLKLLAANLFHPVDALRVAFARDWSSRTVIFLVMQTLDNKMRFGLGRNLFTGFRKRMTTFPDDSGLSVPTYIPIGHEVSRAFARKVGGIPQSAVNEVLLNIPTTAHVLGGCGIGESVDTGVVDSRHRVFGYDGLYICDGSVIPANLGVNPSLTITAMSERAMSLIPRKA